MAKTTKTAKMVQVSNEIYDLLTLYKGMLITQRKISVTFNDVIAAEFNKANALNQLIAKLIIEYPEETERIAKASKDLDIYEYVEAILETLSHIPVNTCSDGGLPFTHGDRAKQIYIARKHGKSDDEIKKDFFFSDDEFKLCAALEPSLRPKFDVMFKQKQPTD